jgi:hypothetical protein
MALAVLDTQHRISLLGKLWPHPNLSDLLPHLVARETVLYAELLRRHDLHAFQLSPLCSEPDQGWVALARMAAESGWLPEEIARKPILEWQPDLPWGLTGRWLVLNHAFAKLEEHSCPAIQSIGRAGRALVAPHVAGARAEEVRIAREGL